MRVHSPPMRALIPTLLLAVACLPQSQDHVDASDYARQLDPLLHENSLLANRVLHVAAVVYNAPPQGDEEQVSVEVSEQARLTWSQEIVPLAGHLHDQAALVQPPAPWAGRHKDLVDIWSLRADAYSSLEEAMLLADDVKWQDSRRKSNQAMLDEENWFREVNEQVAPYGIVIDQFP